MSSTDQIIKNVADQVKSQEDVSEKDVQLVVLELDKEEYAVEITDLQEIIRMPEVTPIPNAPEFISGIFNLRGKIIVVVDLEKRFHLVRDHSKEDEDMVIITEVAENSFGIIVDKVTEIINVHESVIQPTPALVSSKIHADYLKGVIVFDETQNNPRSATDKYAEQQESRLVILLDLKKMLQEKELLSMSQAVQEVINK
jgi:purine-binding chemotaxis protein CheW